MTVGRDAIGVMRTAAGSAIQSAMGAVDRSLGQGVSREEWRTAQNDGRLLQSMVLEAAAKAGIPADPDRLDRFAQEFIARMEQIYGE